MASRVAVDWDDTLVDARTQEWLPGARTAIRQLQGRGYDVFVHTCRANWPEGHASIEAKLAEAHLQLEVKPKPTADFYIDNLALRFDGEWPELVRQVPPTAKVLRQVGR